MRLPYLLLFTGLLPLLGFGQRLPPVVATSAPAHQALLSPALSADTLRPTQRGEALLPDSVVGVALPPPTIAAPPRDTSRAPLLGLSPVQRQQAGQRDAQRCYRRPGPFLGTFGPTALNPLAGLIPAILIGRRPVAAPNLRAPQPTLLRDVDYARGYQQQADERKHHRGWAGYGAGVAAWFVLLFAVVLPGIGGNI